MVGVNIGVDLGTTSVMVYEEGKGIVMSEASTLAYSTETKKILAIGSKAYNMIGRAPDSIKVVRPLKDGVVSDFTATRQLLGSFLQKICKNRVFKPNIVICVPSGITNLEKRTIMDLITSAGAAKACMIEEPLAAAIGAGVDTNDIRGRMVVDIGGGTTDIAVVTKGAISVSKSIKVAGNSFDRAIMRQIKRERDIVISELTAEDIKKRIGFATLNNEEIGIAAKGKEFLTGMPVNFEVTSTEVFLAIRESLEQIVEAIRSVFEMTLPELTADIYDTGIIVTGESAKLRGIDKYFEKRLGVKTVIADDPKNCVIKGTGIVLKNPEKMVNYHFKSRNDMKFSGGIANGL